MTRALTSFGRRIAGRIRRTACRIVVFLVGVP